MSHAEFVRLGLGLDFSIMRPPFVHLHNCTPAELADKRKEFQAFAVRCPDISTMTPQNGGLAMFRCIAPYITNPHAVVLANSWVVSGGNASIIGKERQRMIDRATYTVGIAGNFESPLDAPGAGAWCPGAVTMIVCGRSHTARQGQVTHRLPYFSMNSDGVSHWLCQQLDIADADESELYWVNAYDMDSEPTNAEFVQALNPSRIIALGEEAQAWCARKLSRSCIKLTDPRRWNVMNPGKPFHPLIEALKGA